MLANFSEWWRGWSAHVQPGTSVRETVSVTGPRVRTAAAAVLAAVALVGVAACGSGDSSGSESSGSGKADVAGAKAAIAPFIGKPSEFPVDEPLSQPLPVGKTFAFLQCSTPFCALAGKSLEGAVVAIGGKFTRVNSGATAATSQAAASSIVSLKPDVVFVSVDPALYGDGLKKVAAAGIKIVSISIAKDVKPFGISFNYLGQDEINRDGRLMANWVIAHNNGVSNIVYYGLPVFDFSKGLGEAFEDEIKNKCPSCKVRSVDIDAATIGTTAPRTVVADLQAHPSTNTAVFVSLQIAQGLPAAMKAAGIKDIATIGRGATPANLADIKSGALTAALAIDTPVSTWTAVDVAARLILGDEPTKLEKDGVLDKQILEKRDITFDPTNGWTGYPDFPQRFAQLWLIK